MKKFLIKFIPSVVIMLLLFIFGIIFSSNPINLCTDYTYTPQNQWTTSLNSITLRFGLDGKYTATINTHSGTKIYTNLYDINDDEIVLYNWVGSDNWRTITLTIKDKNTLSDGFKSNGNTWEVVCWIFFSLLFVINVYIFIHRKKYLNDDNETANDQEQYIKAKREQYNRLDDNVENLK